MKTIHFLEEIIKKDIGLCTERILPRTLLIIIKL